MPRQDAVAEAGRKSLDLRLDAIGHVDGTTVGHVTVRPHRLLPARRTCGIEQTLLSQEDEGVLRRLPVPYHALTRRHLIDRAAHVYRPRLGTLLRLPGDRTVQRVVELEDTRTVAIRGELSPIEAGETLPRDGKQ